jgi:hypothetical protein
MDLSQKYKQSVRYRNKSNTAINFTWKLRRQNDARERIRVSFERAALVRNVETFGTIGRSPARIVAKRAVVLSNSDSFVTKL